MSHNEIISLTSPKGWLFAGQIHQSGNQTNWKIVNFLKRMGGKQSREKIIQFCFNGDVASANVAIRELKAGGIIRGE